MTWCQAPTRGRLLQSAGALAVMLTLGACDFPTTAPVFESRYVLPTKSTTISVEKIVPGSIKIVNNTFQLTLPAPQPTTRSIATLCPACAGFNGNVNYPGFTANVTTQVALPADVQSAVLSSGVIRVNVTNNFSFDPINPPGAAAGGSMTINVTNSGRAIGSGVITGAFPAGQTRGTDITLVPGSIAGPIDISVAIVSPAGGAGAANQVNVTQAANLSVAVVPQPVQVSSATVAVVGRSVTVADTVDLEDVDDAIRDHVLKGNLVLKLANPFGVSGTMTLTVTATQPINPITKTVAVSALTSSTVIVPFTGPELQSMLGRKVILTISGQLNAPGAIAVTPSQLISIETSLDLTVQLGTVK